MIQFEVKNKSVTMTVEPATVVSGIRYEGEHEITPTNERQVLPTKYKTMYEDLVINPIPERYGLVTYDNRKIITIT